MNGRATATFPFGTARVAIAASVMNLVQMHAFGLSSCFLSGHRVNC